MTRSVHATEAARAKHIRSGHANQETIAKQAVQEVRAKARSRTPSASKLPIKSIRRTPPLKPQDQPRTNPIAASPRPKLNTIFRRRSPRFAPSLSPLERYPQSLTHTPYLPEPQFPILTPPSSPKQHNHSGYTGNMNTVYMSELNGPTPQPNKVTFADKYSSSEEDSANRRIEAERRIHEIRQKEQDDKFDKIWDVLRHMGKKIRQIDTDKQPRSTAVTPQDPKLIAFVDEQ